MYMYIELWFDFSCTPVLHLLSSIPFQTSILLQATLGCHSHLLLPPPSMTHSPSTSPLPHNWIAVSWRPCHWPSERRSRTDMPSWTRRPHCQAGTWLAVGQSKQLFCRNHQPGLAAPLTAKEVLKEGGEGEEEEEGEEGEEAQDLRKGLGGGKE